MEIRNLYLISDESDNVLKTKARQHSISKEEALEFLILGYRPSTPTELETQRKRRIDARRDFLDKNPTATPEQIWNNGHTAGWNGFQIRHNKNENFDSNPRT